MRVLPILAMAATASASTMRIWTECFKIPLIASWCKSRGEFWSTFEVGIDGSPYNFDANDGCRQPNIPLMEDFCIDWPRERAHFWYTDNGTRRQACMRPVQDRKEKDILNLVTYHTSIWNETRCDW